MFGEKPCGADATLGAFVLVALCPTFESALRAEGEQRHGLIRYGARVRDSWFS